MKAWQPFPGSPPAGYLLRRTPQAIEHFAALRRAAADQIAGALRAACEVKQ